MPDPDGGAAPQLATGAPQGAGVMAAPQAGLPAMAPGTPQTAMAIMQIASKLLKQQQNTKYGQNLLTHFGTILTKYLSTPMLDPAVKSDLMDAIKKLENAKGKMGQGPANSPQLGTTLADIVNKGGMGAMMQ